MSLAERRVERHYDIPLKDVLPSDIDLDLMTDEILNDPQWKADVKVDNFGTLKVFTTKTKLIEYINEHKDNLKESYYARHEDMKRQMEAAEAAETAHNKELSTILITSGYNFEGYRITKYSGYISGDDVTQMPRGGIFGTNNGQNLTDALVRIRRQALKELKEAAFALGCNAVIAVDFDYLTLEPETASVTGGTLYEPYIICVTANGTAVCIEKE